MTVPDLASMNRRGRQIALAYYESGHRDGYAKGLADAQAQSEARWRGYRSNFAERATSFADLCEQRGDLERAERAREIAAAIDADPLALEPRDAPEKREAA